MSLAHLELSNFRNFSRISIDLHGSCNVFYGANGAGKTSLLESIYYLSSGKSFRTRNIAKIIKYDERCISIFGELAHADGLLNIGLEHDCEKKTIKLGGKESSTAEIAKLLPIQLLNHNGYKILEYPKFRRRFIDWGLFHVEPNFFGVWRNFSRLLKQRNTSLNNENMFKHISIWDRELAKVGIELHKMREQYTEKLIPIIKKLLADFLSTIEITIKYHPGWSSNSDLEHILTSGLSRDRVLGFTQYGPHKSDLSFKVKNISAHDVLSRGQQKILFFVISLAQGMLFEELTGKKCMYLADDFSAELDKDKKQLVVDILKKLNAQIFVTGLENNELIEFFSENKKMFHVEHGSIREQ